MVFDVATSLQLIDVTHRTQGTYALLLAMRYTCRYRTGRENYCASPYRAWIVQSLQPLRGGFFFVSRRFTSRIHEISDLKNALELSLGAEYTRFRVSEKHTKHEKNAETVLPDFVLLIMCGTDIVVCSLSAAMWIRCLYSRVVKASGCESY